MKLLLIATTALVCVTSLATAGTLPERQPGSIHSQLDSNGEFLCNYGFELSTSYLSSSGWSHRTWVRAATPTIGKGKSVSEITVKDGPSQAYSSSGFHVAIYTSSRDKPKKKLVDGYAFDHHFCGRVTVRISPTTLERGKNIGSSKARRPPGSRKAQFRFCGCTARTGLTEHCGNPGPRPARLHHATGTGDPGNQ